MRSPVAKTALAWGFRYLALGVAVSLWVPFMGKGSPFNLPGPHCALVGAFVGASVGGLGGAYYGWVKANAGKRRVECSPFDDPYDPDVPFTAKGSTPARSSPLIRKRWLVLAVAVTAALIGAGQWIWRPRLPPRPLVASAIELGAQDRWDDAVAVLRRANQLRPDDAEIHTLLGRALLEQQNPDEAIPVLRHAIQLQPDRAEAHFRLGTALRKQQEFQEAVAEMRRAIELNPGDADFHFELGDLLKQLIGRGQPEPGGLDEVIAEYREGLRLRPDATGFARELGKALSRQGRYAEALAAFEQVFRGHGIWESDYVDRDHAEQALARSKTGGADASRLDSTPP